MTPCLSLYQRLLGNDFGRLDLVLQRFHQQAEAQGSGTFCVRRSPGPWRKLAAWLMGLPAPGDDVPLRVEVRANGQGEIWRRSFGDRPLVTVQRLWRGLLVEAAGPLELGIQVRVRRGGMSFRSLRTWLAAAPLPRWLSPRVMAVVLPAEGGWLVRVRIRLPLIGEVTRYEGKVTPHERCSELADRAGVLGSL